MLIIYLIFSFANAQETLTLQCGSLSGIRYGLDSTGKKTEISDGFSPNSSTTIVWKVDPRTAFLSNGDSRNNVTTEVANLLNNQLNFVTWYLVNDGATKFGL